MSIKKRVRYLIVVAVMFILSVIGLAACDKKKKTYSDYYTFDVSSITTVMLKDSTQVLSPVLKNLGEVVKDPNYSVKITEEEEDVTADVYDAETKLFAPQQVGTYAVEFTALKKDNTAATDEDGNPFTKTVEIEVSILSFAAKDSAGVDVTVDESNEDEAKIIFGESYAVSENAEDDQDSGQYKLTGLTFDGNFSITYKIRYGTFNEVFADPALYFGFDRTDSDKHDDCIKLSTGSGHFATWVYEGNTSNLADLSSNFDNGWNFNVWYNSNNSVSNETSLTDTHYLTIERYLNAEKTQAIYVLLWDLEPFVYLNIHNNFTANLSGLWVESVNTVCTISIEEFELLDDDTEAPTLSFAEEETYYAGGNIYLGSLVTIEDDNSSASLLTAEYSVTGKDGKSVDTDNGMLFLEEGQEYTVTFTVEDFCGNTASDTLKIVPTVRDTNIPLISMKETAEETVPMIGTKIYFDVTDESGEDLKDKVSFKVYNSENADVTNESYFTYTDPTGEKNHVFLPMKTGTYTLYAEVTNSKNYKGSAIQAITVSSIETTDVYGWRVYDIQNGGEKIILCKEGLIFMDGITYETAKIAYVGVTDASLENWTISFTVTGLTYTQQGKLNLTLMSMNSERDGQWEDIALGGKPGNDLWGFEADTIGSGWIAYQWRSVWQETVTTEFMPDPEDHTIGCGRDGREYAQYGEGTHTYTIECSTDEEGNVTYTYYIDGQIEAVHHLPDAHDGYNIVNFLQFQSQYMGGVITDITVTSKE